MQEKSSTSGVVPKIISTVFHPVFIPSLVFAFLIYCSPDLFLGVTDKARSWWLVIIAYITITFPLLVVFLLWRLKFIDSIHMKGEKERYGPLMASMLFYFWVFWLFHKQFNAPELIQSFLFGVFLTTAAVFMATIFFKISMHSAAWGGVISFAVICALHTIQNGILFLIFSLLIAGLVGSIRLYMKAHTNRQVYAGYIVGIVMQLLAFVVIHNFIH